MKRYAFLQTDDIYEALDKLRSAFLAAKNGDEVGAIINAILTNDEQIRIGRRIIVAQLLLSGFSYGEIQDLLKVGSGTISKVEKLISDSAHGYKLIQRREEKVEREYRKKAYVRQGPSSRVFKPKAYTGFRRKDVQR